MRSELSPDPQPESRIALPVRLTQALLAYRQQVWFVKSSEALLAAVVGLVVSFLLVFLLDRFYDTPRAVRWLLLALGSLATTVGLPWAFRRWVWSLRRFDQLARLIRQTFPQLGDQLLGIIELSRRGHERNTSGALVRAAIGQVDADLGKRDLSAAVPHPRHRQWAWTTGTFAVIGTMLFILVPTASRNAAIRWLMPWRDVPRYTFTQLMPLDDQLVVPYAEPFNFAATLRPESPWKPQSASVQVSARTHVKAALRGTSNYHFELPPQTAATTLLLRAGDRLDAIPVSPMTRPALEELIVRAHLPAYLGIQDVVTRDARGGNAKFVEGTVATLHAKATRPLATAMLNGQTQSVESDLIVTEPIRIESDSELELQFIDRFGLAPRTPTVLRFESEPDAAPTISLSQLKNHQVVLSTEVLRFELSGHDDFGVRSMGIEWDSAPNDGASLTKSAGEKLVSTGGPQQSTIRSVATFEAARESVGARTIRVRAFAIDYFPNRNRSYSPYVVLHVLSPDEHFAWITQQMTVWSESAKEAFEYELKLNQTNRELSRLSETELNSPAQRQRLSDQAAAERSNAVAVERLVSMGKRLVKEAARNEEFTAQQLEAWAVLIQQLQQASNDSMPSIARLLQQAAEGAPNSDVPPTQTPASPGSDPANGPTATSSAPSAATKTDTSQGAEAAASEHKPASTSPSAPDVSVQAPPQAGINRRSPTESNQRPSENIPNPTPKPSDVESGFNQPDKPQEGSQTKGGLGLPSTTLRGGGEQDEQQQNSPKNASKTRVLRAVEEQQALLDAFQMLADEMSKLLQSFDNSTFVKRLKAAARRQLDLAVELNQVPSFGQSESSHPDETLSIRTQLAERQLHEADLLNVLQDDVLAYQERKPTDRFQRLINDFQTASAVRSLREMADIITGNGVGMATIESEYWGDTFDRWAEQLVGPPPPHGPPPEGIQERPNLTPQIVVEVLRILDREIRLRDEVRELNQAATDLATSVLDERTDRLRQVQADLALKTLSVAESIEQLPQSEHEMMQKHIKRLREAEIVMQEVASMLERDQTGPETIAAISEVIEILLNTSRSSNSQQISKSTPTTTPAIQRLGLADDEASAEIIDRTPPQATGTTGRRLPEEYRYGLDRYLNVLEQ